MRVVMTEQVAIKYSGVEKGEVLPMVLQVRTGAVDRGASIRDFSQYMEEVASLPLAPSWTPPPFLTSSLARSLARPLPSSLPRSLPRSVPH
jgi:hypothetical protein